MTIDTIVVGGGQAGLAAAVAGRLPYPRLDDAAAEFTPQAAARR
jgi:hypothetical protein